MNLNCIFLKNDIIPGEHIIKTYYLTLLLAYSKKMISNYYIIKKKLKH